MGGISSLFVPNTGLWTVQNQDFLSDHDNDNDDDYNRNQKSRTKDSKVNHSKDDHDANKENYKQRQPQKREPQLHIYMHIYIHLYMYIYMLLFKHFKRLSGLRYAEFLWYILYQYYFFVVKLDSFSKSTVLSHILYIEQRIIIIIFFCNTCVWCRS